MPTTVAMTRAAEIEPIPQLANLPMTTQRPDLNDLTTAFSQIATVEQSLNHLGAHIYMYSILLRKTDYCYVWPLSGHKSHSRVRRRSLYNRPPVAFTPSSRSASVHSQPQPTTSISQFSRVNFRRLS